MKRSTYIILILLGLAGYLAWDNWQLRGGDTKSLTNYFNQIQELRETVEKLKVSCRI